MEDKREQGTEAKTPAYLKLKAAEAVKIHSWALANAERLQARGFTGDEVREAVAGLIGWRPSIGCIRNSIKNTAEFSITLKQAPRTPPAPEPPQQPSLLDPFAFSLDVMLALRDAIDEICAEMNSSEGDDIAARLGRRLIRAGLPITVGPEEGGAVAPKA